MAMGVTGSVPVGVGSSQPSEGGWVSGPAVPALPVDGDEPLQAPATSARVSPSASAAPRRRIIGATLPAAGGGQAPPRGPTGARRRAAGQKFSLL